MIKTRLFTNYMNKDSLSSFGKSAEKGMRGELGNILELRTGYTCNNNCLHCPVAHKRHLKDRSTENCKKVLKNNRKDRNLLIISGGEPTIRKDIFELVSYARKLDYQWIQLKTNGRMFSLKGFAEKFVKIIEENPISCEQRDINNKKGYNFGGLDIFEFYISLHSHNSKLHDFITRTPKSFEQTIQGIKNLLYLNQIVVVNVIITKKNYKYLSGIVKYLDKLGIKYIEFSFVNSIGNALKNFKNIVPKITDVQPYLFRAIKKIHEWPYGLINNIPFCCIRGYEIHSSERFYPYDRHAMYKLIDLDTIVTYYQEQIKNNIKMEKCKLCIHDPICFGLNKKYVKKIEFSELNPIFGNIKNLVEEGKINLFKNLENLKPSDLKLEFDDPKLKVNFNGIKADVITLYSGGVDSTLAAATYAKNNKNKKIVLITFDESHSPGAIESHFTANLLMKGYKNIIKHFIVSIPYIISKKIIYENLEEDYKKTNFYLTCIKCKFLRLSYCIYLHKKYFNGNIIIDGVRGGEGSLQKIYRDLQKIFNEFINEYDIKITHPIKSVLEKREVLELVEKEGLPIPSRHSKCILNSLKTRLRVPKFGKDSLYKLKTEFETLLEFNDIHR
jgi:MoaA/NifB/PqqE/SkfB family radical SAM enzyme/PP-loop superfamily ATP-utilizing enzyme